MQNLYEQLKEGLHFNKFKMGELLCVEYSCPISEDEIDVWSQMDYVIHVLSGKKTWRTSNESFEINSGDTVYIKKGAAFIKQFFDTDFCMLAFFVSDDLIRNTMKEVLSGFDSQANNSEDFQLLKIQKDDLLDTYFQSMLHHFQDKSSPMLTLLDLKFKELIIHLLSKNKNPVLTSYFTSIAKQSELSLTYIMEQNFSFNLTLEEFARLSGRSLSSFKRDFQDHFSSTPGKWLISKRLEKAKVLLKEHNLNVSQVAYECGFKDNSHFGRAFKDKYGTTPLDFRKGL